MPTAFAQTRAFWLLFLLLAGCVQQGSNSYSSDGAEPYDGTDPAAETRAFAPSRYYAPPGPASDPWAPYIQEAASRYRVPERWVRAVMHQESGGREQAVSPVGAMGLMQVMPATYEGLRRRHRLGSDPYDPHNNILAGTAYIREMYDRFGAPGFLAAYNAGPDRLTSYLTAGNPLPDETVNYLAAITPNLGGELALSGPLAMYAGNAASAMPSPSVASFASGCDVNAAYDPDHPCAPGGQTDPAPAIVQVASSNACDPDAAFDPANPCQSPRSSEPVYPQTALYQPAPAQPPAYKPNGSQADGYQTGGYQRAGFQPGRSQPERYQAAAAPFVPNPRYQAATESAGWAIQVGAFVNAGLARAVAEGARAEAPKPLHAAVLSLLPTTPFGGNILYRARLASLSASAAADACAQLNQRQLPCIVVPPAGS